MFTQCLLSALLLLAAVDAGGIYDDLYESKVYKGQAEFDLDIEYKFLIPADQCYGVFYAESLQDKCRSVQLAALQIGLEDDERYPTVNIMDDLMKAIVARPSPCEKNVVVNVLARCAGYNDVLLKL